MADPAGFEYERRKNGEIVIRHNRRVAAILRGKATERFLRKIESDDPQQVMARATGNYRRGNERPS